MMLSTATVQQRTFASRPRLWPRLQYGILGLAACALLYTVREEGTLMFSNDGHPRQLTFLDANDSSVRSLSSSSTTQPQFQTLNKPSSIDSTVVDRLATLDAPPVGPFLSEGGDKDSSLCDDILIYMPHDIAFEGHGAQLNSYLMAAMMATYMNKAMVVLDTPYPQSTPFETNSQFGCPREAFHYKKGLRVRKNTNFEVGLSRLIKHPAWLSSNCPVPCQETFGYADWEAIRTTRSRSHYYPRVYTTQEVRCANDGGRRTKVLVAGGDQVRDYFEGHFRERMVRRPDARAYGWAMRLGARPDEAGRFDAAADEDEIWDFVSALMARSGLVELQPWIARDVEEYVGRSKLPLDVPYDAIHVRRGDKFVEETNRFAELFWKRRIGLRSYFGNLNRFAELFWKSSEEPEAVVNAEFGGTEKFIPLWHYLHHFEGSKCTGRNARGTGLRWSSGNAGETRLVYVATDNPEQVRKEIDILPKDTEGNILMDNGCHKFKLVLTPEDRIEGFHLTDGPADHDCADRYKRTVACIGDMMIAAKSDTFVGELDSNWGRLVQMFRIRFNNVTDSDSRLVLESDSKHVGASS